MNNRGLDSSLQIAICVCTVIGAYKIMKTVDMFINSKILKTQDNKQES